MNNKRVSTRLDSIGEIYFPEKVNRETIFPYTKITENEFKKVF